MLKRVRVDLLQMLSNIQIRGRYEAAPVCGQVSVNRGSSSACALDLLISVNFCNEICFSSLLMIAAKLALIFHRLQIRVLELSEHSSASRPRLL